MSKILKGSMIKCLVFVFVMSQFYGVSISVNAYKSCDDLVYDTDTSAYQISSVTDLQAMACFVNSEDPDYTSATYHLMNDLDLTTVDWIPIGNTLAPFSGTFDGKDHTISHLSISALKNVGATINDSTILEAGLFGTLSGAHIQDLNFSDIDISLRTNILLSDVDATNTTSYIGILAAKTSKSTIENIEIISSSISISNPSTLDDALVNNAETFVGGLIGLMESTELSKVNVETDLSVIYTGDDTQIFNTGGVIGSAKSSTIDDSHIEGTITFTGNNINTGSIYVGGLIGISDSMEVSNTSVESTLLVGVDSEGSSVGGVIGWSNLESHYDNINFLGSIDAVAQAAGGLIGIMFSNLAESESMSHVSGLSTSLSSITNSSAMGEIKGPMMVGGVIGGLIGSLDITKTFFEGNLSGYISGGILGWMQDASMMISQSYSSGTIKVNQFAGGIYGFNLGKLTLIDVYSTMDIIEVNSNMGLLDRSKEGFIGGIGGCTISSIDEYTNVYYAGEMVYDESYFFADPLFNYINETGPLKIEGVYFDHDLLPIDSLYGTPKTTIEMKLQSTFTEYDFEEVWLRLDEFNDGYPILLMSVDKLTYDDGSETSFSYVPHGILIEKPEDPTKPDFIFEGWFIDEAFSTPWNFNTSRILGDVTLYAKWSAKLPDTGEVSSFGLIIGILSVGLLFITRRKKQNN